ncbi:MULTISPECIES: hypothetical protein [Geobacillus]|jgi:hypothetical protein|uniref:Uncharacterized protein n=3 Tax=Geobacillus TaxID=129337 RepID=A4ISH7_GEOTN|nr:MULTISPECIES: hypothetical protein [Geobacillus]ABO68281.1 hypothetical protein GTNG_2936 [Geobacillus thermodenitrificans NG80-2]ARA99775.1 hypothetical protein GD3902_11690 [Geobacillus thermodenitrificans]ATO39052.1 hypothetical protein GTID1_12660 [Geobacillus thermodenitrificans]KQB91867.1 hypothetical protein GEPA3_3006 [Geobacillus sp. PA-3]MED3717457.1 hypothetical protein [Geobacillus thermodenitrificans]
MIGMWKWIRMLKLRDLELFRLDDQDGETVCMLLILDYRRPSVFDDFPILKGIEDEDSFEGAENYIHTVIISEKTLEQHMVDRILEVIEGLVEHKPDCDNNHSFYITKFPDYFGVGTHLIEYIQPILDKMNFDIDLTYITDKHFNYLTQE